MLNLFTRWRSRHENVSDEAEAAALESADAYATRPRAKIPDLKRSISGRGEEQLLQSRRKMQTSLSSLDMLPGMTAYTNLAEDDFQTLPSSAPSTPAACLPCDSVDTLPAGSGLEMLNALPTVRELGRLPALSASGSMSVGAGRASVMQLVQEDLTAFVLHRTANLDTRRQFAHEAKLLAEFSHANLLALHGVLRSPTQPAFFTESIACSLLDLLRGEEVPTPAEMTRQSIEVASALLFLADRGVVHPDVCASHVMVTADGTCKIMGLAASASPSERNGTALRWKSPEALAVDPDGVPLKSLEASIYSFGILLFEIFSEGDVPFSEKSNEEARAAIRAGRQPFKPLLCPRDIFALMQQCWSPNARVRPEFDAIVNVLLAAAQCLPSTLTIVCRKKKKGNEKKNQQKWKRNKRA
jgi:serine/threonine protein kinase